VADADAAIWGTNAAKNEEAGAELAKTARKVLALQCDVGDEAAVDQPGGEGCGAANARCLPGALCRDGFSARPRGRWGRSRST
jgi:hypothetical protein